MEEGDDVWYREKLLDLHGVNLAGYEQFAQPKSLPPNQELLFEWRLNHSNIKKNQVFLSNQSNQWVHPIGDIKN